MGNINFSANQFEIAERFRCERTQFCRIFVSYILFCFSEFGPVDSVKLFKDEFGESLGKAYVNFVNPEVRKSLIVVLFLVVREFFFFFMSVFCFLFVWYFV